LVYFVETECENRGAENMLDSKLALIIDDEALRASFYIDHCIYKSAIFKSASALEELTWTLFIEFRLNDSSAFDQEMGKADFLLDVFQCMDKKRYHLSKALWSVRKDLDNLFAILLKKPKADNVRGLEFVLALHTCSKENQDRLRHIAA